MIRVLTLHTYIVMICQSSINNDKETKEVMKILLTSNKNLYFSNPCGIFNNEYIN